MFFSIFKGYGVPIFSISLKKRAYKDSLFPFSIASHFLYLFPQSSSFIPHGFPKKGNFFIGE
jgi:hypothetical protein